MQNRGIIIKKKYVDQVLNIVEYIKLVRYFLDLILFNRVSMNEI